MLDYPTRPNPLGPIPGWTKERWEGDKPYPVPSLAERNAKAGRDTDAARSARAKEHRQIRAERADDSADRHAVLDLCDRLPDFEKSSTYERVYIDRSGGVYRLQTRDTADVIFSSRGKAASHMRLHGYARLPSHDTATKFAYEREPNQ